jgi:hypothetical protein
VPHVLPREDVAQAVFALLAPLAATSPKIVTTLSRSIVPITQAQPSACPAVYQVQPEDRGQSFRTTEGLYAKTMVFEWWIYVAAPSDSAVPASALLNPILDAVESALDPYTSMQLPFVVDGVQLPIFWDGKIPRLDPVPGIAQFGAAYLEIHVIIPPALPV